MVRLVRSMPWGVRGFLMYAFLLLALVGLTLPAIVSQAVLAPITAVGALWMLLLAYLVFTLTLALQRKQAAWWLALGLATLTLPPIPLFAVAGAVGPALAAALLALALFGGLLRPEARAWFAEP